MRFLSAGESHGKALCAILEGVPSNFALDKKLINDELKRRQGGYGRGGRMKIETDQIEFLSGVRGGITTGAPISFLIKNADHQNWADIIGDEAKKIDERVLTKVRPGHADLAGCIKYSQSDARNILERASARETALRVAAGAICKQVLSKIGIEIASHVINIGGVKSTFKAFDAVGLNQKADASMVRCMDLNAEKQMIERIDFAMQNGDTLGGEAEVLVSGMPVGIGSHIQYDKKLDYILAGLIASLQAVKSVGFGLGAECADILGSQMHDEIFFDGEKIYRKTNNAGGIEGGISNGENIVIKAAIKPIPTLMNGLKTIDIKTKKECIAQPERSDYCAVPAASVVLESITAFGILSAVLDTLGGDTADELIKRTNQKREQEEEWLKQAKI